jgi:hypothetical protein
MREAIPPYAHTYSKYMTLNEAQKQIYAIVLPINLMKVKLKQN